MNKNKEGKRSTSWLEGAGMSSSSLINSLNLVLHEVDVGMMGSLQRYHRWALHFLLKVLWLWGLPRILLIPLKGKLSKAPNAISSSSRSPIEGPTVVVADKEEFKRVETTKERGRVGEGVLINSVVKKDPEASWHTIASLHA